MSRKMSWESHCTPAARQDFTDSWKKCVTYRESNPLQADGLPVGRATNDGNESDPKQQIYRMHKDSGPAARQASAPAPAGDGAAASPAGGHPAAPASAAADEVGGRAAAGPGGGADVVPS